MAGDTAAAAKGKKAASLLPMWLLALWTPLLSLRYVQQATILTWKNCKRQLLSLCLLLHAAISLSYPFIRDPNTTPHHDTPRNLSFIPFRAVSCAQCWFHGAIDGQRCCVCWLPLCSCCWHSSFSSRWMPTARGGGVSASAHLSTHTARSSSEKWCGAGTSANRLRS